MAEAASSASPQENQQQQRHNYNNHTRNNNRYNNRHGNNYHYRSQFINQRDNSRYGTQYDGQNWHEQPYQEHNQQQIISKRQQEQVRRHHNARSKPHQETRIDILIDQLIKNKCECMICCYVIRNDVAIWSCSKCSHIYHLFCIKKWAKSSAELNTTQWRCPACQHTQATIPNKYTCFCEKQTNPLFSSSSLSNQSRGLVPHTCGEVCARVRESCPHKCTLLCHPGPCPTCDLIVHKQCGCTKVKFQVKCSSNKVPQCNNKCEKRLNCGKHFCVNKCHSGDCGECNEIIEQQCYSHSKSRIISCTSSVTSTVYSCNLTCDRLLDCKNHRCTQPCHEGPCAPCELTSERLRFCSCGKTNVKMLINACKRDSCLDPVPTCLKKCEKVLACSSGDSIHLCQNRCHTGECSMCDQLVEIKCRCGAESEEMRCVSAQLYFKKDFKKCDRRCNKKKTCARHKCTELCCDFTDHICTIVCGRQLNCGVHKCEALCHRGNCTPCQVASFDELVCECGQTVVYPPVKCGTRLPECKNVCQRRHACDHEVKHNCHHDEQCPPCTYLTSKMCMGGHEMRRNIPCYMSDVSCGLPCGKPLSCGIHKCIKSCHKGACLNDNETCTQACTKERPFCSHQCQAPCHGTNTSCPDTVCQSIFKAKCKCGLRTNDVKCAHRTYAEISSVIYESMGDELEKMMSENKIDLKTFEKSEYLRKRQEIPCDDECQVAERNRLFAQALEIDPTKSSKTLMFSDFLKQFARDDPKFVLNIEKIFTQLIQDLLASRQSKKSLTMIQMRPIERRFIHELGTFYSFDTQTTKDEFNETSNKVVTIVANRGKAAIPSETLSESMDIKAKQNIMPHVPSIRSAIKHMNSQMQSLSVQTNSIDIQQSSYAILDKLVQNDDEIDYFDFTD